MKFLVTTQWATKDLEGPKVTTEIEKDHVPAARRAAKLHHAADADVPAYEVQVLSVEEAS
jgi:hypothetical protein